MKAGSIVLTSFLHLAMATAQAQEPDQNEQVTTKLPSMTVTGEHEPVATLGIEAAREEVKLTPGGVTLVDGEILRDRNTSSLADMLRYVPGLFIQSDNGGDGIFFSSRGSNLDATDFDMNGIMLLQNGLPVTTADGNNHNRIVDPLSTRYAIVARGANGMKYGASTLGGAINFINPTAYDMPGAVLYLNGGSFGQVQGRATVSKVFDNRFDGLLTVETKQRQGYRSHNQSRRTGAYANAGWRISQSLGTRVYLNYINNNQQLPGSLTREQLKQNPDQAGTNALKGNFQIDVEAFRVANKTTWQIDAHQSLDFGVSYEKQRLFHPIVADFSVPGVPDEFIAFDGLLIETDHRDLGAMVRYQNQIANHNLVFGANYRIGDVKGAQYGNDHGQPNGLQALINQHANTLQAYVLDQWNIGNGDWTLIPAVQLIDANRELDNTDVDDFGVETENHTDGDYFGVNPRLGLLYHVQSGFDLFANVSRLYEPPTFFVLRNDADTDGDALNAMEGTVVEVGTRGNQALPRANSSWGWDLALYYAWIKNEILTVQDPQTQQFLTGNVDNTIHAGIESMVRARIAIDPHGVHVIAPQLSLSFNEFKFDDDADFGNNYLPSAPRFVLRGQVLYRNTNGFYAGPTFDVLGDRYADFANSYTIDSYALLGFLAGWSNDQVNAYVQLENLLDKDYVATNGVRTDLSDPTDAAAANVLNSGQSLAVYGGVIVRFW